MSRPRPSVPSWRPIVVGQFDDGALLKAFARAGTGFIVVPTAVAAAAAEHGLEAVGVTASIAEQFHAVTVERQLDHPAVKRILQGAGDVFAGA
jgi:LysR family transcriptional activator of nhaA